MKYIIVILLCLACKSASADVYVILYATIDGRTGHTALAIEDYDIIIRDTMIAGELHHREDTLANGGIRYFDLWTTYDDFQFLDLGKNQEPLYHILPKGGRRFTLNDLYFKGLPDGMIARKFDGLIRIETAQEEDYELTKYMQNLVADAKPYNLLKYNCSDFVMEALEQLYDRKIKAKEFLIIQFSNTPNKLFRKLKRMRRTRLILDPKRKAKGRFIAQRVLKKQKFELEK